jgi:hypothetical protein
VSGTLQIDDVALPAAQPQNNPVRPTVNVNLSPVGIGNSPGRIQWDSEHKSFAFQEVAAGKYRINVNSAGAGYFVKSIRLQDHDVLNRDFTVDGPTGPIEIVVSNDSGALQGTVTDTDGNPADSLLILKCGEPPVLLGRSQADGKISMQNVPAGPCKAWAFDDGDNVEYAEHRRLRTALRGSRPRSRKILGQHRARARLVRAMDEGSRMERALGEMVRRRQAQPLAQLPRPAPHHLAQEQGRHHLGRRARRNPHAHLPAAALRSLAASPTC